uniref:(northern house mosquito) hypothetical protein n=1 Tax=Culex pipiens TaxID=7175 RepID=A0A8D8CZB9_CULPI
MQSIKVLHKSLRHSGYVCDRTTLTFHHVVEDRVHIFFRTGQPGQDRCVEIDRLTVLSALFLSSLFLCDAGAAAVAEAIPKNEQKNNILRHLLRYSRFLMFYF